MLTDEIDKKIQSGVLEIFLKIIDKIKHIALLYSIPYILCLTYIAIKNKRIDLDIFVIFLSMYFLSLGLSLYIKEEKKENIIYTTGFECNMEYPQFWSPFSKEAGFPRHQAIKFTIDIKIKNNTKEGLNIKAYLKSKSQAIGFVLDEEVTRWGLKYLIIPYREKSILSLDKTIEQSMGGNEQHIIFNGIYRPHFAYEEYSLKKYFTLYYNITATTFVTKTTFSTSDCRLDVPFNEPKKMENASIN